MSVNDAEMQRQIIDIIRRFRALPREIARRRMRQAIRKATKPFEPALRANTPHFTGNLQRSLTTKIRIYNHATSGAAVAVIGYVRGTLRKRRGQFVTSGSGSHAIIVERGTAQRTIRSTGAACGAMPARRMLDRTLGSMQGAILAAIRTEMAAALERTTRELAT